MGHCDLLSEARYPLVDSGRLLLVNEANSGAKKKNAAEESSEVVIPKAFLAAASTKEREATSHLRRSIPKVALKTLQNFTQIIVSALKSGHISHFATGTSPLLYSPKGKDENEEMGSAWVTLGSGPQSGNKIIC